MSCRVISQGVDTLVLFTCAPVRPDVVEQLEALRQRAQHEKGDQPWEIAGVDLEVKRHGVGGARFLAQSDMWALKVNPDTEDATTPTVTIELRALCLWSRGWQNAGEKACEILRACSIEAVPLLPQVSRVDLCVDFQGWAPRPSDRVFLHSKARKRSRHWVEDPLGWQWLDNKAGHDWVRRERDRVLSLNEELKKAKALTHQRSLLRQMLHLEDVAHAEHDDGRHFSGFSIGSGGAVSSRLYDKRRECETRHKTWFEAVWGRNPAYQPEAGVWRLEFQLRREGLRTMRLQHDEGTFTPSSWDAFRLNAGSVWRYLAREWLYHGTRTALERACLSEEWVPLANASGWQEEPDLLDLHREAAEGQGERITAGLAGYLTSAAALAVEAAEGDDPPDFGSVVNQVLAAAYAHAQAAEKLGPHDFSGPSGMEVRYRRKMIRLRARRPETTRKSAAALRRQWLEEHKEGIGAGQWVGYGFHPRGPPTAALGGVLLRFDGQGERAEEHAVKAFDAARRTGGGDGLSSYEWLARQKR